MAADRGTGGIIAVVAGLAALLWRRGDDSVSRRHFIALLAASGLVAAVDGSLPSASDSDE